MRTRTKRRWKVCSIMICTVLSHFLQLSANIFITIGMVINLQEVVAGYRSPYESLRARTNWVVKEQNKLRLDRNKTLTKKMRMISISPTKIAIATKMTRIKQVFVIHLKHSTTLIRISTKD